MAVADSTSERILQAVRAWLKMAAHRTPLTDEQVIVANDPGPRPDSAYLTVRVLAADVPSGTDHKLDLLADLVTVGTAVAGTTYTVTVNGTAYAHVRLAGDTNTTIAAALATLINADEDLYAVSSGANLTIGGAFAAPTTSVGANLTLTADAVPAVVMIGHRSTTISIQGYGRETLAWLERAFQRLDAPEVRALNDAAGVTLKALGGMTDLAALLDTSFEHRYGRDVIATYKRHEDPSFATLAETVDVDLHVTGSGAELVTETTIDLT